MTIQTLSKPISLKAKIVEIAVPFGANGVTIKTEEKKVRIVTRTSESMRGICRRFKEDTALFGKVDVSNDGLRAVILKPTKDGGVELFEGLMEELGDLE